MLASLVEKSACDGQSPECSTWRSTNRRLMAELDFPRQSATYRLGASQRFMNAVIGSLTRFGLAGRHTYILTVRGRKTGRAYSTPVRLIEGGERWLVAPYGEVGRVRNARAAGKVEIRRAGRSETLRIEEIASDSQYLSCSSTSSACRPSVASSTSHQARRSTIS